MEPGEPQNPEDPVGPQEPSAAPESDPPATEPESPTIPPIQPPPDEAPPIYGGYTRYPPDTIPGPIVQSNYPRYYPATEGPVPPGPPMIRFAAIGQAWELIQQDFAVYAFASLILVVLSVVSYYAVQFPMELLLPISGRSGWIPYDFSSPALWGWGLAQFVASRIVSFYLGAGYFSICIKRLRGERISVWQVFSGFRPFFGMFIAAVLVLTLEASGWLLVLVPGMFAVGVLAFVPQIMMDQRAGPLEAIRMSYFALKRDWAMMWVLAFSMSAIAFLGSFACGVGVVFTAPLYYLVLAIHYHAYFPAQGGPQRFQIPDAAPQLA